MTPWFSTYLLALTPSSSLPHHQTSCFGSLHQFSSCSFLTHSPADLALHRHAPSPAPKRLTHRLSPRGHQHSSLRPAFLPRSGSQVPLIFPSFSLIRHIPAPYKPPSPLCWLLHAIWSKLDALFQVKSLLCCCPQTKPGQFLIFHYNQSQTSSSKQDASIASLVKQSSGQSLLICTTK